MKKFSFPLAGCIFLVTGILAHAEQSEPNNFSTLDGYLGYGIENNARLAASYEQWRVAAEQVPQARALPDPKFTYELETQRTPHGQTFGIMQTMPWFGTIKARTDTASAMEQAARKRYEAQRLKLVSEIKRTYYDYRYLSQQISIARQNLEILKHFEEVTRIKYATAQMSHPDHIRAEIEIANAEYDLLSLEESKQPMVAKLNSLLNRPSRASLPIPTKKEFKEIQINKDVIIAAIVNNNPDLQAAQFDLAAGEHQVELAKKRFYPEFDFGIDALYQSEATMGPGAEPLFAKVGITLPIWTNSYSAGERQARANVRQINNQKVELANQLAAQAEALIYEIEITAKKAKLYKDVIIPRSQEMLGSYDALYRSGGSDFLNLLDAQRTLLKTQLDHEKAITEYDQKAAELEALAGGRIEY